MNLSFHLPNWMDQNCLLRFCGLYNFCYGLTRCPVKHINFSQLSINRDLRAFLETISTLVTAVAAHVR